MAKKSASSLWYQLGTTGDALFATSINWSAANNYDTGYDPTVAVDDNTAPSATTTTVVEVHQAGVGVSGLWYHVGTLTLGASPSMSSWSGALEINPGGVQTQGYVPTVSVANNLAILVAQGTSAALWYSIGVVDTSHLDNQLVRTHSLQHHRLQSDCLGVWGWKRLDRARWRPSGCGGTPGGPTPPDR